MEKQVFHVDSFCISPMGTGWSTPYQDPVPTPYHISESATALRYIYSTRDIILVARALRIVSGVKCKPFLKYSHHWKRALKIKLFSREAGNSSFLKLSLLLQRNTKHGSLQFLAFL